MFLYPNFFPPRLMAQVHSQRNSMSVSSRIKHSVTHGLRTIVHHLKRHVGVGIVCSVAYFDPCGTPVFSRVLIVLTLFFQGQLER